MTTKNNNVYADGVSADNNFNAVNISNHNDANINFDDNANNINESANIDTDNQLLSTT